MLMQAGRRGRPRNPDALTDAEAWEDLRARADADGSVHATVRELSAEWGWSHGTTVAFLRPLRGPAGRVRVSGQNSANFDHAGRALLRYHGGKVQMAAFIVRHLPPHRVYVEPFGGGAGVLLHKPRSVGEVYNDMDGEVVNVFRVMRSPALRVRLARAIRATPFSRAEFVASWESCDDPVEQARRTIARSFMGFSSTATSRGRSAFRSGMRGEKSSAAVSWSNYPDTLESFGARLAGVTVEGPRPAEDVMRQYDSRDTLHYVDPPYPHSTRSKHTTSTGKGYRFEMHDGDSHHLHDGNGRITHHGLAQVLHSLAGMVVLSGYACDLYDRELYPDWHRVTKDTHADGALDRTEVLWINPKAWEALGRQPGTGTPAMTLFDSRTPLEPRQ
jgi:DNA adenine methylase